MRYFDVHTHILPGIDDGAQNKEQGVKMIEMLKNQGITDIILTPHFYQYEISLEKFLRKRHNAFEEIRHVFDEYGIKPHLGAEVYLTNDLFQHNDVSELCIDKGEYLLVELPFDKCDPQKILYRLNRLCANFHVKPILAHIEKYPAFFNRRFLHEANALDCVVQVDVYSFKNPFIRGKMIKYITDGLIQLAGTDCHNLTDRKPDFGVLKKYVPPIMYEYLFNNSDITF